MRSRVRAYCALGAQIHISALFLQFLSVFSTCDCATQYPPLSIRMIAIALAAVDHAGDCVEVLEGSNLPLPSNPWRIVEPGSLGSTVRMSARSKLV